MDTNAKTEIEAEEGFQMKDGTQVDDVQQQFTLEAFLRDAPFPSTKTILIGYAHGMGCSQQIMAFIHNLPDDAHEYKTLHNLMEAMEDNGYSDAPKNANAKETTPETKPR